MYIVIYRQTLYMVDKLNDKIVFYRNVPHVYYVPMYMHENNYIIFSICETLTKSEYGRD